MVALFAPVLDVATVCFPTRPESAPPASHLGNVVSQPGGIIVTNHPPPPPSPLPSGPSPQPPSADEHHEHARPFQIMPGKMPHSNGKEPVENGGIRGNRDVDMKDKDEQSSLKAKGKKASKDGEEEMTVVVPPSKKQSSAPPPDADGDVAMDDSDKADDGEVKIDPVVQTVAGALSSPLCLRAFPVTLAFPRLTKMVISCRCRHQEQFRPAGPCRRSLRCQILPPRTAVDLVHPQTPDTRYPCPGHRRDLPRHRHVWQRREAAPDHDRQGGPAARPSARQPRDGG